VTDWASAIVAGLRTAFEPLADASRAVPMQAYMKDVAPFLGIPAPERRRAQRPVFTASGPPPHADAVAVAARALWDLPEREYQYAASELVERHVRTLPASFLPDHVEHLLVAKSWWDSVDSLVGDAVVPLVTLHPELVDVMRSWVRRDDRWLVRAAILHQLGRGHATDRAVLFELCAARATDREFFIAKAIGWALRDLSWKDPAAVRAFIDAHPELTALARREGAKRLPPP
jgi:3-methyladenine DNA glycosylase AlkD